jgi:cysteinyl-tRNA synthetase
MSHETLGETFDIHGGGDDLKFPHHENEIAQGEAHGGGYARCWMHNGLIQYDGVKVGKSDPRMKDPAFAKQFKADHLLDTYGAATVRFLLMQGHYRRPNDFAPAALSAARTALGKLHRQLGALLDEPGAASLEELLTRPLPETAAGLRHDVVAAMDDDFNTGAAIAALFGLVAEARRAQGAEATVLLRLVRDLGRLIGLFQPGDGADTVEAQQAGDTLLAPVMELVLALRQDVRARRDFATADRIRDTLATAGIAVKDGKDGATWSAGAAGQHPAIDAAMQVVIDLRGAARAAKDFATTDRIRQALTAVGVTVADGPAGATWSAAR